MISNKMGSGSNKKVRFCPRCEGKQIKMKISDAFSASVGIHPWWICKNCELKLPEFPFEKVKKMVQKKNKKWQ